MSDDLVKRLRVSSAYKAPDFSTPFVEPLKAEAADRIEELEAKLAKAVEGLQYYACNCGIPCEQLNGGCGDMARTTLAELKGEYRE